METYTPETFDFRTSHVQTGLGIDQGKNFISSESILLCAMPATLTADGARDSARTIAPGTMFPIGVIQNFGLQQQKQLNQLYEIGSKKSYFIPGRTMIQVQLSRVLFAGDSLMGALYGDQADSDDTINDGDRAGYEVIAQQGENAAEGKFYMNLAAVFFNKPTNLAMVIVDSENQPTGAIVLEECYIQAHGLGMAANQTIVAENVSIRCQNVVSVSAFQA